MMSKQKKFLYPIYEESNFIQQEYNNDEIGSEIDGHLYEQNVKIGTSTFDRGDKKDEEHLSKALEKVFQKIQIDESLIQNKKTVFRNPSGMTT
mmetsp:Transcript_6781/g.6018  ORF Transcript_6781/g.6018 Transcript_6781/m.6018 type:complete len:93 (+) Transcript_6781:1588-1866(+)